MKRFGFGKEIAAWVAAAALVLVGGCRKSESSTPLICHVGGTMRPVMQELAAMYEARTGQAVEINSAGSGELLAHIEMQKSGDVYVCHDPFMDVLMAKGLGVDGWTVAELEPVIVVRKGNPKSITGLADLGRDDVEVILTDYRKSTLGRMLSTIFAKADIDLPALHERKKIETHKSGGHVANKVKMGAADAAIVWNAVAHLRLDGCDIVPVGPGLLPTPGVDAVTTATQRTYKLTPVRVTVSSLACSTQPKAARRFAEFCASETAHEVFDRFGFKRVSVTREYAETNKREVALRLYAGAGLRRAVEKLAAAFTAETGIAVECDYAGSGMLITRAQQDPAADLFMPGDVWYVDQLAVKADLIESKTAVARFTPVIITAPGNPKGIRSPADLLRDDVRVGLGNAKACQVGRLTDKLLAKSGVKRSDLSGPVKESLTVNELGVWVKMGDVDAAIVWDAIAANIADAVEVVPIDPARNILSHVAVGLMRTSTNKAAAGRFIAFAAGEKGRAVLAAAGYATEAP